MKSKVLITCVDDELRSTLDNILLSEFTLVHFRGKLPGTEKIESLSPLLIIVDAKLYDEEHKDISICFSIGYKVLVCGGNWSDSKQINAYTEGMSGYCSKENIQPTIIMEAVSTILKGDIWIKYHLISTVINILIKRKQAEARKIATQEMLSNILSVRELEVVRRVQKGEGNKVIADNLNISERTVKAHLNSIFKKLNVKNRLNLILFLQQS